MTLTLSALFDSIAAVLTSHFSVPVYASPTQQATVYPCFFLTLMPSSTTPQVYDAMMREINIDVTYIQQRNVPNGNAELRDVVDFLDENLALIPYTDEDGETGYIHCLTRDYSIEDQEMHYKIRVKQRLISERDETLMQTLESENIDVES